MLKNIQYKGTTNFFELEIHKNKNENIESKDIDENIIGKSSLLNAYFPINYYDYINKNFQPKNFNC